MSAVHELTLQPEFFHMCTSVDRPTAKAGFMADELFKEYKENPSLSSEALIKASDKVDYYKGKFDKEKQDALLSKCSDYWESRQKYESSPLNSTPIYLDVKGRERVLQCVRALKENESIQKLLHPEGLSEDPISENEQAILLDVKVIVPGCDPFVLKLKAKLDNYTIDKETNTIVVNDVKTIGKIVSEFPNNFKRFHYHRELSLYSWLLSLVAKKHYGMENCTIRSNCLVVSTKPKYYNKVYEVTKDDFTRWWEEFKALLRLVAHYYNKGYRFI